jgi:hypothetical protein
MALQDALELCRGDRGANRWSAALCGRVPVRWCCLPRQQVGGERLPSSDHGGHAPAQRRQQRPESGAAAHPVHAPLAVLVIARDPLLGRFAEPSVVTSAGATPVAAIARRKKGAASSVARYALTSTATIWPCSSSARYTSTPSPATFASVSSTLQRSPPARRQERAAASSSGAHSWTQA